MKIDEGALEACLSAHLPSQRWFGAAELKSIEQVAVLREERLEVVDLHDPLPMSTSWNQ